MKVIVFGTFDLIHKGHIHMLKEARSYGDYLVVVVSRDQTVGKVKGKTPKFDEQTRLKQVKDLGLADKVRLGYLEDKYRAIAEEKPDVVALGYDQREFVDNLEEAVGENTRLVRLSSYHPEIYKSSKLKV